MSAESSSRSHPGSEPPASEPTSASEQGFASEPAAVGSLLRKLPAVDALLRDPAVLPLAEVCGRDVLTGFCQETVAAWRAAVLAGRAAPAELEARLAAGALAHEVAARVAADAARGLVPVVNATGVVLHTGLGRAPVHPDAARAMAAAAGAYCVLEVDRATGERNRRDDRTGELLARLTGAAAGIAVNNNAAAVVLLLSTFAQGREVVLSRGELVEIGGSFRMPDVMERAGVRLREVGTTNRTRIGDYRVAIGPATGLLLKVHTSNFRVEGFTEEVLPEELAALGREAGLPSAFDLGSGRLEAEGARSLDFLGDEPLVRAAVASGIDVVCFSGDKLLGGPQAGLLVGSAERIDALRANPLYRALRLDKVTLAGLEATLGLYLAGRGDEVPARRMLLASAAELAPAAERLAALLAAEPGVTARVAPDRSQPGSGSAPGIYLDTTVVRVRHARRSADRLAAALRRGDPPVFARIDAGELVLDPRGLLEGDVERVGAAFAALRDAGPEGAR